MSAESWTMWILLGSLATLALGSAIIIAAAIDAPSGDSED